MAGWRTWQAAITVVPALGTTIAWDSTRTSGGAQSHRQTAGTDQSQSRPVSIVGAIYCRVPRGALSRQTRDSSPRTAAALFNSNS